MVRLVVDCDADAVVYSYEIQLPVIHILSRLQESMPRAIRLLTQAPGGLIASTRAFTWLSTTTRCLGEPNRFTVEYGKGDK